MNRRLNTAIEIQEELATYDSESARSGSDKSFGSHIMPEREDIIDISDVVIDASE